MISAQGQDLKFQQTKDVIWPLVKYFSPVSL